MDELAFSLSCDIRCEKCSVSGLVKSVGIHLRDKLFVPVGMRSLFTDGEMDLFLKTVLSHGFRILLLDSVDREKSRYEKRLTIDKDLCEF